MTKYFVESSEVIIYRTEINADTPEEAVEKVQLEDGKIVNRYEDVTMSHGFETFAVYDEEDNEIW